jgi:hypothetical protein
MKSALGGLHANALRLSTWGAVSDNGVKVALSEKGLAPPSAKIRWTKSTSPL